MIIVTGEVRFGDGEIERLREVLSRNVESSRAEAGCALYVYAVDLSDPNLLQITEMWHDEAALDAHNARIPELMAPLADARIEAINIEAYEGHYIKTVMGNP